MIPKDVLSKDKGLGEWAQIIAYRGSIAHGMYTSPKEPTSIDDKDVMAVCIPDQNYYFALKEYGSRGTREIKQHEWDIVVYEWKKFIFLLRQGNPNVLSMLWLDPKHYIKLGEAGHKLIEARQLFVGKHVYRSFSGYAHAQLYKMTHLAFEGYMGKKRKTLVQKFGYDTKNAAHLIRLLRMAIEFLNDGRLYVERHDATQLLQIKRGEWELEKVKEEADRLFKMADDAFLKSTLPVEPDLDKINEMSTAILTEHFNEHPHLLEAKR